MSLVLVLVTNLESYFANRQSTTSRITTSFGTTYKKPDPIYTKLRQDVAAKHGAKAIQGKLNFDTQHTN